MKVAYQDLEIFQGSTHVFEIVIFEDDAQTQPADLTGYSVRSAVKKSYTSVNAFATFECSTGPITTISDFENDTGIHAITIKLSSVVTDSMIDPSYVYDIEIYSPSTDSNTPEVVYRVLEGKLYISKSVTR